MVSLSDVAGFGPILLARIEKKWPTLLSDPELARNPYRLTEARGVGFKLADRAGQALGIEPDSPHRIEAAAEFVLTESEQQGHTALNQWHFIRKMSELLQVELPQWVRVREGKVTKADKLWSRVSTLEAERFVGRDLLDRMNMGGADFDLLFSADGLAPDQLAALRAMQRARVFCLTGSPGTGKTSTVRAIISRYSPNDIALAAPTGKAAKRLEQLTGRDALTIHRLLEVVSESSQEYRNLPYAHSRGFKFRRHRGNRLAARLVVVDEASMLDIYLMADLLAALRPDARLLLIGDSFQLPSVGPGAVLRDLLKSNVVPSFELTELKRQDPTLMIARNCRSIRYERRIAVNNTPSTDFFFIPADDPAEITRLTVDVITRRLPSEYKLDPMRDVITLCARKKQGLTGAENLNCEIRRVLNPSATRRFEVGDRVIQCRNDYELGMMNGDLGVVAKIDDKHVSVRFEVPDRVVNIPRDDLDVMHAWALTVHKSQGSEWPWVVIPIHQEQGDFVVSAQHFYTAISRARVGCIVVGQRAWMDHVAANHRDDKRSTRLAKFLTESVKGS